MGLQYLYEGVQLQLGTMVVNGIMGDNSYPFHREAIPSLRSSMRMRNLYFKRNKSELFVFLHANEAFEE